MLIFLRPQYVYEYGVMSSRTLASIVKFNVKLFDISNSVH